jgi:hypothetical protein
VAVVISGHSIEPSSFSWVTNPSRAAFIAERKRRRTQLSEVGGCRQRKELAQLHSHRLACGRNVRPKKRVTERHRCIRNRRGARSKGANSGGASLSHQPPPFLPLWSKHIPSMRAKHTSHPLPAFPVYSATFLSPTELVLGAGGGASKSGVKNKLVGGSL